MEYKHRLPSYTTRIGRFGRDLGKEGWVLLGATIDATSAIAGVKPQDLERAIVDATAK